MSRNIIIAVIVVVIFIAIFAILNLRRCNSSLSDCNSSLSGCNSNPITASPMPTAPPDLRSNFSSILFLYNTVPQSPSSNFISIRPAVSALPLGNRDAESVVDFRYKQIWNAFYIDQKVLKTYTRPAVAGIQNDRIPVDIIVKNILKKSLLYLLQQDVKNNYDIAAVLMVIASSSTLPFNYTFADINSFEGIVINRINSSISVVPENSRIQTIGQNLNVKFSDYEKEDPDYKAIRPLLSNLIKSYLAELVGKGSQNATYNLNAFSMMVIVKLGTALLDTLTILDIPDD